jgi:5-deoxy-glucuronate isomerase
MTRHITAHRSGYAPGLTWVTSLNETVDDTGIAFGVLRLKAGETWSEAVPSETAALIMSGDITIRIGNDSRHWQRNSLFDQSPRAAHVAAKTVLTIEATTESEVTLYRCGNTTAFAGRFYEEVPNEHRGKGQVGNACLRFVRTIFDRRNSPAEAQLVLGEVVTMPGRWSSYPPHHHPQPEIYHYRFTKPQGYGLCELGDDVLRVKQYDTVKIFDGNVHPQTAAPGYGMYYVWVIRHLPDNPYTIPDFTPEHAWVNEPGATSWFPEELRDVDSGNKA